MGLTGPIPPRVPAETKTSLLDLIDQAASQGWSQHQTCDYLQLGHRRCQRWQKRRDRLGDHKPGGTPVNGITPRETQTILDLFEEWGQVDRSHRKLAHRGSWLGRVWVSPSTVRRVLHANDLAFRFPRRIGRSKRKDLPEWVEQRPNQVWIYDTTHWDSCSAATTIIIDLVSRKWVGDITSVDETSIEVQAAFNQAIRSEGLEEVISKASEGDTVVFDPDNPDMRPVLIAMSDNGSPMRSDSTLVFMSMSWIGTHFGRPGTPTDQAWIETKFGHLKEEFPHLDSISDVEVLRRELAVRRVHYNTVRLHQGIGYVTPDQEHRGLGEAIREARREGLVQARINRIDYHQTINSNFSRDAV